MKKTALCIVVALLVLTGCDGQNYRERRGVRSPSPSVSATPSPTAPALAVSFSEGKYVVGKKIQSGKYGTNASFSTGKCVLTINASNGKFIAKFTIAQGDGISGVRLLQDQVATATGGCLWTREGPN